MSKMMLLPALLLAAFTTQAQKPVTIEGTLSQPVDARVIVVNVSRTAIISDNKQEALEVDSSGKFRISIPVTQPYSWIIVAHGQKRLDFFVKEGSNLRLTAEGARLDSTAHFEGKGADIPEYFARRSAAGDGIMTYYSKLQETAAREPAAYPAAADSVRKRALAAAGEQALDKDFYKYWDNTLRYSGYDAMLQYPVLHEMLRLQTRNIQQVPRELYAVAAATPQAFDDRYLDITFYQNYVQAYYAARLSADGITNTATVNPQTGERVNDLKMTDSVLQLIYTGNMPGKTAEFAAGRILASESEPWSTEELKNRVAAYRKRFPKSANNKILDSVLHEKQKFDPGQPAVDFRFTTLEGKSMKLSDLKGKVVYMDFWASWCGPCKGEMPHAKKIKEHFKDKDVVFLYVSIDDKEAAWKNGIESMQISGVHTRTPGWGGDIARLYTIQSVPAYFLIDRKGNFVLKKTPRPSQSAEVIRQIEALL